MCKFMQQHSFYLLGGRLDNNPSGINITGLKKPTTTGVLIMADSKRRIESLICRFCESSVILCFQYQKAEMFFDAGCVEYNQYPQAYAPV
jgi:hypothetical protein